ncbi:ribosome recycling factor [Patescibacteria group bacterium]|nr:ribosome recycling factor [Patescibacteria group bacterium]
MLFKESIKKTQERFKEELKSFRTGRASVDLISDIQVEAYGASQPLSQLTSIGVQDAHMLVVEAWDKSIIKNIEKAIISSDRNVSSSVDGNIIRVSIPETTEETRRDLVKLLNKKLEEARVSIRRAREEQKKRIESNEKSGSITEDDKRDQIKSLDQDTKDVVSSLEQTTSEKEKEIMTI